MQTWRLLHTERASGAFNMAVDDSLAQGIAAGSRQPVLRFFGWSPPAVSFGYAQEPHREVDVEKCRRAGIDLVRRPTGGRAVLHWEELTYSVICPQDDSGLGGSIEDVCRTVGQCLEEGLRLFGVEATLERVSRRPVRPRGPEVTLPCFSSIARWEVKCRGRKLIGSAQRRAGGAILQHGSLLIGPAHRKLLDLLAPMPERLREAWRRQLVQGSIHLEACTHREVDLDELAACLAAGFSRRLSVAMEPGSLSPFEARRAAELIDAQYGNPAWTPGSRAGAAVRNGIPAEA